MNIEDMTALIRIYDAYSRLCIISAELTGDIVPSSGSIVSEFSVIESLIMRHSVIKPDDCPDIDIADTEYSKILNNTNLPPKERAALLLGT
ncbi:MAG: hypothetical protein K6G24_11940 [Lachnospiraceae bacterium]|nr:hypothetical protein [Lachnospiraceae bacterium]